MPTGIYIRTEEHKKNISKAMKGKPHHNKGIPMGKERRKKLSEIALRQNRSISFKGRHHSEESKKKMSISSSGEKSSNWKGGISPLMLRIRSCFKYRQWRCDVFTRDDFTCQRCGDKGVYLEAHHCGKKFSDIFSENKIRTFEEALMCEELWNINNGETLCINCHNTTKGRILEAK